MMITCMNDPGAGSTPDPLFNPGYSQFCYELPFMPGQTQYMDTPVTPTSAFSEGYNHPDCSYPDATPAISEVDGDGKGPWVSAPGHTLTITALGNQNVLNNGYSGPSATTAPFNQKTVQRHYGFGSQCTTAGSTCTAVSAVTIGGVPATINSWSDTSIKVTVPAVGGSKGIQPCVIQQQSIYSNLRGAANTTYCGQLVITAGNGKQSIDAVTVTIGGNTPKHVTQGMTIQSAIDAANPGDLIMVDPGVYNEMLLMWKPVRLQGVGAASSVINANTQPAGKLDPWRRQVGCLFGLALNGRPLTTGTNPNVYDPTGTFSCSNAMNFADDRLPLEAVVGWDATLNGNLAEQLQEPSLMGAYEGAGITVLGKGVNYHGADSYASDTFPTGTTLLTQRDCGNGTSGSNPFPSNFWCNPSRIDGLSVTDSSQGGGGIFAHGWTHNLEISNNRVYNNTGTLSGGISIGQGEFPPGYVVGGTTEVPGSCDTNFHPSGTQLPYCFNLYVNVHNNYVTQNSSIGDELFSSTPSGAGGVAFCSGADYYKLNYNWICGNLSTGDGGGVAHLGFIWNGDIEHNSIVFNQSTNPTVPANGGGLVVMGAPDTDPVCQVTEPDADCPVGLSDGTGPGLVINANLFQGNAAESGSGGGIRLQGVNGSEVARFYNKPSSWYSVTMTNNIITNNVAGWDGAGISLQDALAVNIINNTIASNDSTASAGVLFNTLGAPLSGSPLVPQSGQTTDGTTSRPQPAGLVAIGNSSNLTGSLTGLKVVCPIGHANCAFISNPLLYNDLIWENRSFYIGVSGPAADMTNQQNQVTLFNSFSTTPAPSQPQMAATQAYGNGATISGGTGACPTASYWDIGVRGDAGPKDHGSGYTLSPVYSILSDTTGYSATNNHNTNANPDVVSQYCNGSRTPPEMGSNGYQVPPGISDATVPNPWFNLKPAATVDEGNNWVNISWGPLALINPVTNAVLGNYAPAPASPAIDYIPPTSMAGTLAPSTDYFGNPRRGNIDVGAVEYQPQPPSLTSLNPASGTAGSSYSVTLTGNNLTGANAVSAGTGITVTGVRVVSPTSVTANFAIGLTAPTGSHSVTVTTPNGTSNAVTFTVNPPLPTLISISPATGHVGTTQTVTLTGVGLSGATAVTVSGTGVTGTVTSSTGTTVTATFTISANAATTARTVSVTTPNGTTNTVTFTVIPPTPTLTSIIPTSGTRGSTVSVTLTGTNLTGATVNVFGGILSGITVSNVAVKSSTSVTAQFQITNFTLRGTRTVTVTTPGGTSNSVNFGVN